MSDLRLSPEQTAFREESRNWALQCLRPFAAEADRLADIPPALLQQPEIMVAMRAFMPLENGGGWPRFGGAERYDLAGSAMLRAIFNEEAAYGDAALFIGLPGPGLTVPILNRFGTKEQKSRWFSHFLGSRPRWAAFAMSEPTAGSDFSALKTVARKEDKEYVLNGTKWFVGNGLRADWIVVFATTNSRLGRFGIKAFVVERGMPGFRAVRSLPTLGLRAVQISELQFDECRIPETSLLNPANASRPSGFDGSMLTMQEFRPAVAAMAVGTARHALEQAYEWVRQNGSAHSAAYRWRKIRDELDALQLRLRAARLLCWKAALLQDAGGDSFPHVCMAKAFAAEVSMQVCSTALRVAGVAAISPELPMERLCRDAKAFDILEGTGDMQRLMLARALLRAGTQSTTAETAIQHEHSHAS